MNASMATQRELHKRRSVVLVALFFLAVVTRGVTVFRAAAFAQNYGTSLQSAAGMGSAGGTIVPGDSGTTMQPSLPSRTGVVAQQGISATLLGVPVYGTAPLTVGFYVGVANPQRPLVYQWNFGDGAVESLPAGAYLPHVYQHPGTYSCYLTLAAPQGSSTTLFTTITVQAPHK